MSVTRPIHKILIYRDKGQATMKRIALTRKGTFLSMLWKITGKLDLLALSSTYIHYFGGIG